MPELKNAVALMSESRSTQNERRLAIEVRRSGDYDDKQLRFIITGFDMGHPQYAYNILHVVRQEKGVRAANLFSQTGEVHVTLEDWQLITDELMVKLSKVIGADALGFPQGHVDVTIVSHN